MDQTKFQEAQSAYDAGDFRSAAKGFLAAAGRGADGNGAAYHMAGNALVRLRRHQDAVTVYGHALRDGAYGKRGAVRANMGAAYYELGEYAESVQSYKDAVEEPDYPTPYKAWQGMAKALMGRGKVEDAAVAYRRAALDPANPEPGKALVNLGLCFMALHRPTDAVEAYKAALGFDNFESRGKALSNLGQAFVAAGMPDEAVKAFEKATQLHDYRLSASALKAYEAARAQATPARDVVEGWETGEIPVFAVPQQSGWDTAELTSLTADTSVVAEPTASPVVASHNADPFGVAPGTSSADAAAAAAALGFGDDRAVNRFFNMTEAEMKVRDREARRVERVEAGPGAALRPLIGVAVVVFLIAVLLGVGYFFGYGWPTQKQTVANLLSAHEQGGKVAAYWVAVPDKDVSKEMAKIPPLKSYKIVGVTMATKVSSVSVSVTPLKGAALRYTVQLAREGVGWKVTGVENDWTSSGD